MTILELIDVANTSGTSKLCEIMAKELLDISSKDQLELVNSSLLVILLAQKEILDRMGVPRRKAGYDGSY